MTRIDLHTHSSVSDGELAPADLVALAASCGVTVLAVTDHDTTDGVPAALAKAAGLGIEVVSGVELGCVVAGGAVDDEADILGYLFEVADGELQALLGEIQRTREQRARVMVERLRSLGARITFDDVAELSGGGAIGRPHVARALVACGFVTDVSEAFRRFIGRRCQAYADRYRLPPAEACMALRAAGGVPVLAHPVPPGNPWSDPKGLRKFLPHLVEAGLGGLECYYPGYTPRVNRWLEALAHHFGLVPTGGTDYHGSWRAGVRPGAVDVPPDTLDRLRSAAAGARGRCS